MTKSSWQMLITEHDQTWATTLVHVKISLIALLIVMVITIPLVFILKGHKKTAEFTLQTVGIIQTISSLAILGLLLSFVGIGTTSAIIALILYAIMSIFQNTYSGLTDIPDNLEKAATVFDPTKWKKLQRLETPMTMPMISVGVRTALVMIIGAAALAALIGGGGLGTHIYVGINSNNNTEVLMGAILSALPALVLSGVLRFIVKNNKRLKWESITIVGTLLVWGGSSLYSHLISTSKSVVEPKQITTIAGKMGFESATLINTYKDLIEKSDPDTKVVLKPNFGGAILSFKVLQTDEADIYPEFTGTVLQALVKTGKKIGNNSNQVYVEARSDLKKQFNVEYLKPMAYQNGYVLATTQKFVKDNHLTKMSDLNRVDKKVHVAFDPGLTSLKDGYSGLKKIYKLGFTSIKSIESSIRYHAIANNQANIVDGHTTDAEIKKCNLVMLDDDKKSFPPYQGASLMKAEFAERNPQIVKALNKSVGKITTQEV